MLGAGLFKHAAQEAGKTINGIGGLTRRVGKLIRYRKPGTEYIDAGINKIDGLQAHTWLGSVLVVNYLTPGLILHQQWFAFLNTSAQNTVSREMGQKKLHLVIEDLTPLQVNVLSMCGAKGDSQQFHTCLLRCATCLVVITTFAGSDDVYPAVLTTLTQGVNMIS